MPDYKKMYLHLFNAVTDAVNALGRKSYCRAMFLLIDAQMRCEDLFIDADGPELVSDEDEPLPIEDPGMDICNFSDYSGN